MAGLEGSVSTEGSIALTAATAKTVLQLVAAANHRVKVGYVGVFFDGVTPTAVPVLVRVLRQTTAGTMSSATPKKNGDFAETLQTTAQKTATAEPTAGDVIDSFIVHPQSGFARERPYSREIKVPGGTRLGIECTAAAAVNVRAVMDFEE